ncbi:unnamed protein product [Peronospora destructor]|uniref:FHA domain-containing protein n=1 Tax=Peronospora destructor TaxID=86335 RepID=A0AAV0VC31_9STRA|nr:unnamed protein product [Peronospora destructor]
MEAGRRKRALEDDDDDDDDCRTSPRALYENENISPRPLYAQVGLPTSVGSLPGVGGVGAERGRVTDAVKSRRLNVDIDEASATRTALASSISPVLQVFTNDTDAARSPSQTGNAPFVSSPYEMKKAACALKRAMFALRGAESHGRPTISTSLGTSGLVPEHKTSPLGRLGEVPVRVQAKGVSPMGNLEQKSPVMQGKSAGENLLGARGLPTISHLLKAAGHGNSTNPVFESMNTPYRVPAAASTTTPSSKQQTKRQPFPLFPRRTLETIKGVKTPVLNPGGMLNVSNAPLRSFHVDDLSSDEELVGIPGPDILDLEVSFSQDKLGDLSFTENNVEEKVALILCDGLANSLTKFERDRMEVLNLFIMPLTQQSSPIMLGREQFQNVFGDNIRGGSLSLLSRRHCLIHVENMTSRDNYDKVGVKVRIEDTSTNGSRVNGIQLNNGETHELELNDIVTLLTVRRDEDDVSLGYKLIRSDPAPEHNTRKSKKNRHDGRYVRPSDKFLCELPNLTNCCDSSPVQESNIASLHAIPARAVVQEMRHLASAGASDPNDTQFFSTPKDEMEMSKPKMVQQISIVTRKIRCTILFADQSTQDFPESSQPLEEASFDYREELSEVLSAFALIDAFDASPYRCATTESIKEAIHDGSDVLFYAGGGDENHLVVEAPNGLSARLEKDDVLQLLSSAKSAMKKLVVVISPSREPACLLAKCGVPHVCFLSSDSKHSLRVTAFIRALVAGLLKGFSVEKSYTLAEFVAINDLLPIMRPSDQICEMLPQAGATDINAMVLLSGSFIPVLATHFLGRDAEVEKVKAALGQKVRVCNIYGPRGVGKSSIAIHIAKTSYRTRTYRNGVHYFAVDKLVKLIQNGINLALTGSQSQSRLQRNECEDTLPQVMDEVETLLRSLSETDPSYYPTTLVVLDGCDIVLPVLEVFVLNTIRTFPGVQILITSAERVRIDTDDDEFMPERAICIEELGKLDCARLFMKQARGHLTSSQFRQYFPDSDIEAISDDERLLGTKGNLFWIARLVYELESQAASSSRCF